MAQEEHKAQDAHQNTAEADLGFGRKINVKSSRFVNKDGTFNISRNAKRFQQLHLYQWLVLMKWRQFFVAVFAFYIVMNSLFAVGYLIIGIESLSGAISGSIWDNFWQAFFFSVQTLTTVGYGSVSPAGFGANILAAVGALTGLLSFALATGLMFARFSRPSKVMLYSDNALIVNGSKGRSLQFRIVSRRKNILLDLNAIVILTWLDCDDGLRKFQQLNLERDTVAMLPLNWNIVHHIDENSPIRKWTKTDFEDNDVELLVIMKGFDDTFAQQIRSHNSYKWQEVKWNAKFKSMYDVMEDGSTVLQLDKLSEFEKQKV